MFLLKKNKYKQYNPKYPRTLRSEADSIAPVDSKPSFCSKYGNQCSVTVFTVKTIATLPPIMCCCACGSISSSGKARSHCTITAYQTAQWLCLGNYTNRECTSKEQKLEISCFAQCFSTSSGFFFSSNGGVESHMENSHTGANSFVFLS